MTNSIAATIPGYPRQSPAKTITWRQSGFTLLEVIVALAITGFLLGGLLTLLAGSKQLSWRSEASLVRAIDARAQINFALLENEYNEVEPVLENDRYFVRIGEILEDPERKTQAISYALETYELVSEERDEVIIGTRWLQLELPR
jgi:prepilin-type N-terminal cleavage/methylation domain-containing protein